MTCVLVFQVWEDVQKSKDELFSEAGGSKRGPVGTTSKCVTAAAVNQDSSM